MNFFKSLNLRIKTSLRVFLTLLITFGVISFILYSDLKNTFITNYEKQMFAHLDEYANLVEVEYLKEVDNIQSSLNLIHRLLTETISVKTGETTSLSIFEPNSLSKSQVEAPVWIINDSTLIYENQPILEDLSKLSGYEITIFQKTEVGYVRIATTLNFSSGQSAQFSVLEDNAPQLEKLQLGQTFIGTTEELNQKFFSACDPIFENGNFIGFLCLSKSEQSFDKIATFFNRRKNNRNYTPYIFSSTDTIQVHSTRKGQIVGRPKFTDYAKSTKRDLYRYFDDKEGDLNSMVQFFSYFEPYDIFIALEVNEEKTISMLLSSLRWDIIFYMCSALIISIIVVLLSFKRFENTINKVFGYIDKLASGKEISIISAKSNELAKNTFDALNRLIVRLNEYSKVALSIGKGNFSVDFEVGDEEDVLGNSLMSMRDNLRHANEEESKRRWAAEGNALLSETMRNNTQDLGLMVDQLLYNLVKYIEASHGAIFIARGVGKDVKLILEASYAYSKKKILKKEVLKGEGLIGQVYVEKETTYMNDIPEDYVNIISGVGVSRPKSVLIVPLLLNNEVFGVLEVASLKEMPNYVISFVEAITRGLAAAISNAQYNDQIVKLLEESQQMTESQKQKEERMIETINELNKVLKEKEKSEKENQEVIKTLQEDIEELEKEKRELLLDQMDL